MRVWSAGVWLSSLLWIAPVLGLSQRAPTVLPAAATLKLSDDIEASLGKTSHVWRDIRPVNADGTVNVYVEIARGDRREWEFDVRENKRAVDRVVPASVGGYPANYGFVPQTAFMDGDPFDALVLGPALPGGRIVRGVVVGLMIMEDGGLADPKAVVSPVNGAGRPLYRLMPRDERTIGPFFERYKRHEAGASTSPPAWGTAEDALAHIRAAHAFFKQCASTAGAPCRIA
jgi:inorganic pyrophosphatase